MIVQTYIWCQYISLRWNAITLMWLGTKNLIRGIYIFIVPNRITNYFYLVIKTIICGESAAKKRNVWRDDIYRGKPRLLYLYIYWYVARWHGTYGHIQIVLTSTQKVDNRITVWSQLNCRESGVLRTTGNIGTSLSSSISHEVWDKPTVFIGTWLGVSFTIFHVEGEGKNTRV